MPIQYNNKKLTPHYVYSEGGKLKCSCCNINKDRDCNNVGSTTWMDWHLTLGLNDKCPDCNYSHPAPGSTPYNPEAVQKVYKWHKDKENKMPT